MVSIDLGARSFTRSFDRSHDRLLDRSLDRSTSRSPAPANACLLDNLARSFVQSFACRGQRGSSSINDIKVDQLYRGLEFQSVNMLGNVFNAPYPVELAAELASN